MKPILILAALAGCAQLTGDPAKDCLNARQQAAYATAAATAAGIVAANNPQSATMRTAAALAIAARDFALAQQAAACPVTP